MWSQWSESKKQKPQATRLTRTPRRTNLNINVTGGTEFEKYIASRADEKNLRKTLPVIADTGLNAPKRKEQKKQKFVSSSMKKIKEIAETVLKNKPACNQ